MKALSQLRFDSLAGYSRSPTMALVARDLAWYEEANERILGLIALDLPDQDYVCYVLGRDAKGRFRAVWLECDLDTQESATVLLEQKLAEFARAMRSAGPSTSLRPSCRPTGGTRCFQR